jgi:hypothetical protein
MPKLSNDDYGEFWELCNMCGTSYRDPMCPHIPMRSKDWTIHLTRLASRLRGKPLRHDTTYYCEYCQILVDCSRPHGCERTKNEK